MHVCAQGTAVSAELAPSISGYHYETSWENVRINEIRKDQWSKHKNGNWGFCDHFDSAREVLLQKMGPDSMTQLTHLEPQHVRGWGKGIRSWRLGWVHGKF